MHSSGNLVADTICRTAEIGLTITGAADAGNITIIDAAPVAVSDACPECSQPGTKRVHFPGFGPSPHDPRRRSSATASPTTVGSSIAWTNRHGEYCA